MMNMGHRHRLLWGFAIVLIAGALPAAEPTTKPAPGRIRLTISRKTTHILGPINEDGTVNYMAYLNAKHSKGVTKANNAAIPLIEILGKRLLDKDLSPKICKILKIKSPVEGASTYITFCDYTEKTLSKKNAESWRKKYDDLTLADPKPWSAKQYPVIALWLKANNNALDATLIAVQRPRYYMPGVPFDKDEHLLMLSIPGVSAYVELTHALITRAMLKLDSKNATGAWADLTAARHFARRVGSGFTLIDDLIAMAIEKKACAACRSLAGSGKLTGAQARTFLADMQRLGPLPDPVDTLDKSERLAVLDCVMMLARATDRNGLIGLMKTIDSMDKLGGQPPKTPSATPHVRSLEWDEILLMMNPWYDNLVAASRQKTFKARTEALADYNRRVQEHAMQARKYRSFLPFVLMRLNAPDIEAKKELTTKRMVSRAVGNVLLATLLPAISRIVVLRDQLRTEGDLSVVTMALAAYRAEKKAYPDKLSQLSPGYLKKVPDDLFVDKPFGYKRTDKGYLLYSVGENMKYDGEKKKDDDDEKDDIVVRVE